MAASQLRCLEDDGLLTPITESSPEFFYSEGQRLAVEALLGEGIAAYTQRLERDKLRPFLSEVELRSLLEVAQDKNEPAGAWDGDGADDASLSYWPECSEEPTPNLDLGWPQDSAWKGITQAEIYTHPPAEQAPKVKELVRRRLQQATKVVAIVMDIFTDPDILSDLHDTAVSRRVPVYLILCQQHLAAFLSMAEKACLNIRYMENLRVRVLGGCTFQSHQGKQATGALKEKFILIDGNVVITGSYSFTWTDARLHRQLVMLLTGDVAGAFDQEFRTLYAASHPLRPPAPSTTHASLPAHGHANGGPASQMAPFLSTLAGVHLSLGAHHVAERRSVAPQPVAKSRAGDWAVVRATRAMAADGPSPINLPEATAVTPPRRPMENPRGHAALSDIHRSVQRARLVATHATGQRPTRSLWDLSRLSQFSGSSTDSGQHGTELGDDVQGKSKWGYQDTPARALMRQRGAPHTGEDLRQPPVFLSPGYKPPGASGYLALGRLQGQLYHGPVALPRPWGQPTTHSYGKQWHY